MSAVCVVPGVAACREGNRSPFWLGISGFCSEMVDRGFWLASSVGLKLKPEDLRRGDDGFWPANGGSNPFAGTNGVGVD
jgi:hypothetical protein